MFQLPTCFWLARGGEEQYLKVFLAQKERNKSQNKPLLHSKGKIQVLKIQVLPLWKIWLLCALQTAIAADMMLEYNTLLGVHRTLRTLRAGP